jgi:hypothetical protein
MKLKLFALITATMFLAAFKTPPPAEPGKHALVIAIGGYEPSTGWQQISSKNDIPLIKGSLLKLGFPEANIATLEDSQADRKGILAALTALQLRVKPNDMVVIHISSHGQQITDDGDDEVDGYDEAIVGYGAPVNHRYYRPRGVSARYDGSLHLRDEELGNAINEIRAAIGTAGHVLVVLDACHSGTGTRGSAKVRGGEDPLDIDSTAVKKPRVDEEGGFGVMGEGTKSRGSGAGLGKFVLISGASAHEVNYETEDDNGNGVGSLSYCVSKVMNSMPKGTTYRAMFAAVLSEMANKAPKQTPQLEGDINNEVFGGKYVEQKKYLSVVEIKSPTELKINAGKLMNVFEGTPVAIEKSGASGPSKTPLAIGKVTSVTNFEAVVTLTKPLTIKNKVDAWVFTTGTVLPEKKIKVNIESIADPTFKAELAKAIQGLNIAEKSTGASDLTIFDTGLSNGGTTRGAGTATNQLQIGETAFGSPLGSKTIAASNVQAGVKYFIDMIQNYSQGKMFLDLDVADPAYAVKITRMIPAKGDGKDINDLDDPNLYLDKGNMLNIPAGKYIFLEVQNVGTEVAYFNIIDIEPSGKINPMLPVIKNNTITPEIQSLQVDPGEKKIIKFPMKVSPPYGIETIKVISTGVPFDVASTIVVPEYRSRGDVTPIQKILGRSFEGTSSRGVDVETGDMGTNTFEFTFKIVEKKP